MIKTSVYSKQAFSIAGIFVPSSDIHISRCLRKIIHWSVEMDESADQIFSKTLQEFLKDT